MKIPTLKQVREHFKNAEVIKTQYNNTTSIDEIVKGHVPKTFMLKKTGKTVWTEEKGYAEIIQSK